MKPQYATIDKDISEEHSLVQKRGIVCSIQFSSNSKNKVGTNYFIIRNVPQGNMCRRQDIHGILNMKD